MFKFAIGLSAVVLASFSAAPAYARDEAEDILEICKANYHSQTKKPMSEVFQELYGDDFPRILNSMRICLGYSYGYLQGVKAMAE